MKLSKSDFDRFKSRMFLKKKEKYKDLHCILDQLINHAKQYQAHLILLFIYSTHDLITSKKKNNLPP